MTGYLILFAQDYSLDLDGSNDYVQVADDNALDISSSITVSAWIYNKHCK